MLLFYFSRGVVWEVSGRKGRERFVVGIFSSLFRVIW